MAQGKPEVGDVFLDKDYRRFKYLMTAKGWQRQSRTVTLVNRINPQGDVAPYWQVKSSTTGELTTIREDRLLDYSKFRQLPKPKDPDAAPEG